MKNIYKIKSGNIWNSNWEMIHDRNQTHIMFSIDILIMN